MIGARWSEFWLEPDVQPLFANLEPNVSTGGEFEWGRNLSQSEPFAVESADLRTASGRDGNPDVIYSDDRHLRGKAATGLALPVSALHGEKGLATPSPAEHCKGSRELIVRGTWGKSPPRLGINPTGEECAGAPLQ